MMQEHDDGRPGDRRAGDERPDGVPAASKADTFSEPDPVELPMEDYLDLHFFRPKEIPEVVVSYLEAARDHGFEEVRLVHGKGTGFQRKRVRETLETLPFVLEYSDAPASRGHWGATLVRLDLRKAKS